MRPPHFESGTQGDVTSPDYRPLVQPPADHAGVHRYLHVVGAAVWIDDRPADPGWRAHFIGLIDGEAWWGIDVPADADPSDGASLDTPISVPTPKPSIGAPAATRAALAGSSASSSIAS